MVDDIKVPQAEKKKNFMFLPAEKNCLEQRLRMMNIRNGELHAEVYFRGYFKMSLSCTQELDLPWGV